MKNSLNYLLLIVLTSHFCCAQKKNTVNADNEKTIEVRVVPIVYLLGGIVSTVSQQEMDFAKKYNVSFYDFGCLAPINLEKYEVLNARTFELLNIRFGPK